MQVGMTVHYHDSKSLMRDAPGSMSPMAYDEPERGDVAGDVLALSLSGGSLLAEVVAISTASTALPSCADADEMLRVAAELARDVIGLQQPAFFMRDPSAERLTFRGTWGIDADGATRSLHEVVHELSVRDGVSLQNSRDSGLPALCRPRSTWFAGRVTRETGLTSPESVSSDSDSPEAGAPSLSSVSESGSVPSGVADRVAEETFVMITPLFAGGHLVGMMCNDTGRAQGGEPGKQAAAAVLCGMVAIDYLARRGPVRFQPLGVAAMPSQLVQRIRDAIDENPTRRGKDLAVEFGVSPGHLARAFKREMGLSLVDYRNRKRIDRFWDTLRRRGRAYSLKQAAFDAGFGSYAQFNRIHKKLVGVGPRLGARRTEGVPFESQAGSDAAS
jgi:AraC-like DNA-binding protein